jgi:hypothetical protein
MAKNALLGKAWTAFRFVAFGVFGFVVMMSAFLILLTDMSVLDHKRGYLIPLGLLAISILGAVMMLFGVGEWGRWGYLFVFLSIPVSLLLLFLFPHAGKDVGVLVPALASIGTYIAVRAYYARRKKQQLSQHA